MGSEQDIFQYHYCHSLKDKLILCYTFTLHSYDLCFFSFQRDGHLEDPLPRKRQYKCLDFSLSLTPLPATSNFQSSQLLTIQHNSRERMKIVDLQLPWQHRPKFCLALAFIYPHQPVTENSTVSSQLHTYFFKWFVLFKKS